LRFFVLASLNHQYWQVIWFLKDFSGYFRVPEYT
jgi:hypothetical protein